MPSDTPASPNDVAAARLLSARPRLVAVRPAGEVVPGLEPGLILHAAPPQAWEDMSELLRGGMIGAALNEGLAATPEEAASAAAAGSIRFAAAQDHASMAGGVGSITASTPVVVVEDAATGARAFHPVMEGLEGKALVLGMYEPDVLTRLRWMAEELAPALDRALQIVGGIDAHALMAEGLRRGDELHNRNAATSSLLAELLAPGLAQAGLTPAAADRVFSFIATNPQFFVAVSLAACRLACDAADGVPGSSLVTACGANGTEAGVRISGVPGRWFTAPAEVPEGVLFDGFTAADAGRGCGDSLLIECYGLGATVLAAAPALWPVVGVGEARARELFAGARQTALGEHADYRVPLLDDAPAPAGVDARRVLETGRRPIIDIVMVHRELGRGAVGFGLTSPPAACFEQAVAALDATAPD
ncbi:YlbE family protein [Baekduia soli]|nr:DUF1116 domain-containing protein [Baekduia soli]